VTSLRYQRLYVNIDHVATVRQARRGAEPDPVAAAVLCEQAGADGITAHLREDRRHIQDADIHRLATTVTTALNLECAATDEMLTLAETLRPVAVTLVPERREEVTTEGGLDVFRAAAHLRDSIVRLKRAGVRASLFIDPEAAAVRAAHELGADAVELHTGQYAHAPADPRYQFKTFYDTAKKNGFILYPGKLTQVETFRVGCIGTIGPVEMAQAVHAIALTLKEMGIASAAPAL
jgi:pyridoxine 5-phosphate synthase